MHSFLISIFNFLILVGLLGYKLRKPSRDYVSQRYDLIRGEIQSVHEQLITAEKKYAEFSAKLQSIDAEIQSLKQQAQQDITDTKQRMFGETEKLCRGVLEDAKAASETLFSEFKNELYAELSFQVLDRAEQILRERLTGDDRVRIQQEFSRQLEAIQ